MSIRDRLRRLEGRGSRCPECRNTSVKTRAFYPEAGDPEPEPEACEACGRPLEVVIRVVYEEASPGARGGAGS